MTKKLLFGILTFLGIGLSFCSAGVTTISGTYFNNSVNSTTFGDVFFTIPYNSFIFPTSSSSNFGSCIFSNVSNSDLITNINLWSKSVTFGQTSFGSMSNSDGIWSVSNNNLKDNISFIQIYFYFSSVPGSLSFDYICTFSGDNIINNFSSSSSSSSINVFYNGFNDVESFTCDGDTAIYLDGNYNYTSSNSLFSPYINIHYTDSDNQVLTGKYEKSDLFLNGQYNKIYTGGSYNYWVFDPIESPNLNIISYQPTFDVEFTGDIIDTGNVFNNFAENSLKFTLSNIPNYIQYVIIIMLLFFVLGFIRKFRRK